MAHKVRERGWITRRTQELNIDQPGAVATGARSRRMCRASSDLAERRLANDFGRVGRKVAEALRQECSVVRDDPVSSAQVVRAQRVCPRLWREAAGTLSVERVSVLQASLMGERVLLALNPYDLTKADLVNLLRGEVSRRIELQRSCIPCRSSRKGYGAHSSARCGRNLAVAPSDYPLIGHFQSKQRGSRIGQQYCGFGLTNLLVGA